MPAVSRHRRSPAHQMRRPWVLGQTQARLVALPLHKEATIQFEVKLGGLTPRVIVFGADGGIPQSVFGAVVNDPLTISTGDFPHEVVEMSGIGSNTAQAEGQHGSAGKQGRAFPPPVNGLLSLESDALFTDCWEERVRVNDRWGNICYNFLRRFGLKRARNRLMVILLSVLLAVFSGGQDGIWYLIVFVLTYCFLANVALGTLPSSHRTGQGCLCLASWFGKRTACVTRRSDYPAAGVSYCLPLSVWATGVTGSRSPFASLVKTMIWLSCATPWITSCG